MLMAYILTPFQWSILSFAFVQLVSFVGHLVYMNTQIQLLKAEMAENNKRDSEVRKEIEGIKKEEKYNWRKLYERFEDVCQAVIRTEEKVNHIEKQLDK